METKFIVSSEAGTEFLVLHKWTYASRGYICRCKVYVSSVLTVNSFPMGSKDGFHYALQVSDGVSRRVQVQC